MDLMPNLFGAHRRASANSIVLAAPSANSARTALERGLFSGMRLVCNQLDQQFSFQNLQPAVRPLPLLLRKTYVGSMKFGVEYNQRMQQCQGTNLVQVAQSLLDPYRAFGLYSQLTRTLCRFVLPLF